MTKPPPRAASLVSGAAFLMAVSAIGPGFLTQTTQFTAQLGANLAFAVLISIVIDIGAQLNTWRVICIARRPGQEVADAIVPGLGWVVTAVIVLGSFAFNVGNLNGCALGLELLFGLPHLAGAALSALLAIGLFLLPRMLAGVDWFSKLLGAGIILMTLYVVLNTARPMDEVLLRAVWPAEVSFPVIVTFVGGTIGGYIMFSGAHRLLDGGIAGPEHVDLITAASVRGIIITGGLRFVLFLAVLGVVLTGATVSGKTPVFDAFRAGAGQVGCVLSGLVFWSAAITSVVGCSYTSISFLGRVVSVRSRPRAIIAFIAASLLATVLVSWAGLEPSPVLIFAGKVNGMLIPVVLGVVLVAAYRRSLMGEYRHPWWAGAFGAVAWLATAVMAGWTAWDLVRSG
jgi:Mn2+/Fe2+ NRAMP family transporter